MPLPSTFLSSPTVNTLFGEIWDKLPDLSAVFFQQHAVVTTLASINTIVLITIIIFILSCKEIEGYL